MTWASGRRFLIGSIVGAVALAIVAVTIIASVYQAPSCSDNKQNQSEAGVDCGGPCPYLCAFQVSQPSVRFARPVVGAAGRTNVIAYIDNSNPTAAVKGASYQLSLYAADGTLVAQQNGTVDIPPSTTVPVFVPDIFSGQQQVKDVFLKLEDVTKKSFFAQKSALIPSVSGVSPSGTATNPRLQAILSNPSTEVPLTNVRVVATVFDASGNVIEASATLIPSISASGNVTALFTWNMPFARPAANYEVIPLAPLP